MMSDIFSGERTRTLLTPDTATITRTETVKLPDKTVKIIGTDHGTGDSFPGIVNTEFEIKKLEQQAGKINGLVMDSLPDVGYAVNNAQRVIDPINGIADFPYVINWAIHKAQTLGIPLVGADPNTIYKEFNDLVEAEITNLEDPKVTNTIYGDISRGHPQNSIRDEYEAAIAAQKQNQQDTKDETKKKEALDIAQIAVGTVAFGILANAGIPKLRELSGIRFSRRNFLRLGAATAGGVALASLGIQRSKQQTLEALSSLEDMSWQIAFDQLNLGLNQDNANMQFQRDMDKINKYFAVEGSAEPVDAATRLSEFTSMSRYGIVLRNALTAEVLCSPAANLVANEGTSPTSIPVIMGELHQVLPEEFTIGGLMKDEKRRQETIRTLILSASKGAKDLGLNIDMHAFTQAIRDYPRTHWIDKNGHVETKRIEVPGISKVLDTL